MARLTTLSKFIIALVVVGLVYFGITFFLGKTDIGKDMAEKAKTENGGGNSGGGGFFGGGDKSSSSSDAIRIGVVTWGGYIGGQYYNEGFEANTASRYFKDYGFKVEFKVLDDPTQSRDAWKNDNIDLLWATVDALPTEMEALAQYNPRVVFQSDWSRGGDAIVARRGLNSVADLRGKTISVAEMSPSHSFLIWMLSAGGMTVNDVKLVKVPSPIEAAEAFKANQVDAAVVWSPFDEECIQKVPGSRILESTRNASNIIADVFIAKGAWLDKNREKAQQLYEGWMKGAAEINSSETNKRRAAGILAKGLAGFSEADALGAINNVRLATHGDNMNFFGLTPGFKDIKGEDLYVRMTGEYRKIGVVTGNIAPWRTVGYPDAVKSTTLSGPTHAAEGQKTFAPVSAAEGRTATAVATKRVSISFRSGEYQLDENSKYIIDKEFLPIAQAFANARVRVEGNTDNTGNREGNLSLSQRRAASVVDYMVRQHGMPKSRFLTYGNGPDKPVAPNTDEDGKSKNRRTDFELLPE
jgi:NitT/TauT family transport system substrate-binding protein